MYMKINPSAVRILMMSLLVVAVINVLIVLLMSTNYYEAYQHKIKEIDEKLRDKVEDLEQEAGKNEVKDDAETMLGDLQFDLAGNALFREDKMIVDDKETDWRLKRNSPISRQELTTFLQTTHRVPKGCRDKSIFVVTFVISTPYNIYRRNAIRDSWAKVTRVEKKNVMTIFVMGKHPDSWNHGGIISLQKEIGKYRDILKGRFKLEREIRTSLKILLGLQYIREHCRHVSYVLVVHDTMFVNYRRLVKVLKYREGRDSRNAKLWIGNVQIDQKPIRDTSSSHYISEKQYNHSVYPPFCSTSAGYVMSITAAREVYNAALTSVLFPFIDLFTGVVAKVHNWTLIHNNQLFNTGRIRSTACAADRVATAVGPDNPDMMISICQQLENFTALRNCMDPDLELVISSDINNGAHFDAVLKTKIDHPNTCHTAGKRKRDIFMVVFISSHPDNLDMRKAIRSTWGKDRVVHGEQIRLFFVLGTPENETKQMRDALKKEDARYKDIIQAEFVDSFKNITLKVVLGLKWITMHCPHVLYVYKGDEDMFVNFKNIVHYLMNLRGTGEGKEKFFLGSRIFGNRRFSPDNDNDVYFKKYHVPDNLYRGHYYPPYCSGSGYILSGDVVPAMYREAFRTPIIGVADAFQGILAKRLEIEPKGHRGFKTWGGKLDTCSLRDNNTMNVHGIGKTASHLYQVWEAYNNRSVTCKDIWRR